MTVNLAKVVPFLGTLLVAAFWALVQTTGDEADTYDDSPSYGYSSSDTSRADAYLDQVAVELAQPGVYADPAVLSTYDFTSADVAELDRLATTTPGPVRVAVIPASAVREGSSEETEPSRFADLAYEPDELVAQLYDRVGVDGTYAILVDADSQADGRSFTAYQYAEERPFYDVEDAVDAAVDCCAPDYDRMLDRFLAGAGDEQTNLWPLVGWIALGLVLLLGVVVGFRNALVRRTRRQDDAQVADALRPALQEEVVELSRVVSALPPSPAAIEGVPGRGDDVSGRTRRVLDLVEEARQRLDVADGSARMDTPSEVEDVVRRLGDARYELVAIDALRRGEAVPERTAPCFFDPRHGPSVAERPFEPEFGLERPVPVCAACAATVDAGREPVMRTLTVAGRVKPYWQWDRYTRPYVNGYWQRHAFADQSVQRSRYGAPRAVASSGSRGLQFVWESHSGGGSSGSSGGGRSFRGSSGRRRSFGGGRSGRSSRRSGGSRGF